MKKLLSKILRNDLDLNKHWWHRLCKVAFLVVIVASLVISAYITWDNNMFYSKPYPKDYLEITSTLSDYISKHSKETLTELNEMFSRYWDAFVVDYESFEHKEYKIWDIIEHELKYEYSYEPYADRVLWESSVNKRDLEHMQCKEWMTVDDVIKYKKYHYDSKYYTNSSVSYDWCDFFPSTDSKLKENIKNEVRTSNCIFSYQNCMYIVWKNSVFMWHFLVAEKTEKSVEYADHIYHKNLLEYYKKSFIPVLLKTILVSVWVAILLAIVLLVVYYKWVIYIIYWNKKK